MKARDLSFVTDSDDLSIKYLFIFYEMIKQGMVKLDLSNPEHMKTYAMMLLKVKSYDGNKFADQPKAVQLMEESRHKMYQAIVLRLFETANKNV